MCCALPRGLEPGCLVHSRCSTPRAVQVDVGETFNFGCSLQVGILPVQTHFLYTIGRGGCRYLFTSSHQSTLKTFLFLLLAEQHRWTSRTCLRGLDLLPRSCVLQERWHHSICPCHLAPVCGHGSCSALLCHLEIPLPKPYRLYATLVTHLC